jgi:hypothetical protein
MVVLGPAGAVAGLVAAGTSDVYGAGAALVEAVALVTCSGDAGELAAEVSITVYETGISEVTVLLAGQSVTSAAQEVMVAMEVE